MACSARPQSCRYLHNLWRVQHHCLWWLLDVWSSSWEVGMSPIRIANRNARRYVETLTPFIGSNLFAEFRTDRYVVYSYGSHFPLFIYSHLTSRWYANSDRYSQTTSKQRSQCFPFNTDKPLVYLDTDQMRLLASEGFLSLVYHRMGVTA